MYDYKHHVVSMLTVTRGIIIELNVRIETRMAKISFFFACFCSSTNTHMESLYSRQIDPYFETLRALAGKHRNCEKLNTNLYTT